MICAIIKKTLTKEIQNMRNKYVQYMTQAAVIAALYSVMTILQNILFPGSASMAVQFRVSEVMTVLALFTPSAIPGLTIGCIIANISSISSIGAFDIIFGSTASCFAAVFMYLLRNVRFFKIPFLSLLMPALMNGIIIGFEIDFFFVEPLYSFNLADFLINGGCVALGELAVLFILGLPVFLATEKRNLSKKLS